MSSSKNNQDVFREFFKEIKPIKFREPLAETLGAFKEKNAILEYTFADTVKMAGHACPTVASAYIACEEALKKLHPNSIPVRGNISITVYGEPDETVYGVMSQVFSFITGAAWVTGFKGIAHKFKRKNLLEFGQKRDDGYTMHFRFKRIDNNKSILIKLSPQNIAFPPKKSERLSELLEKVIWEAAKENEIDEFHDLWMEKVKNITDKRGINNWLKIESD